METVKEVPQAAPSKPQKTGNKIFVIVLGILALISIVVAIFISVKVLNRTSPYANTTLVLYQGPKTMKTSATKVSVDGKDLFVYNTAVNNGHTWVANGDPLLESTPVTYFDFKGKVQIKVTVPSINIKSCKISPVSENIKPEISGHTVTFEVTKNTDYTLQFNGSVDNAVHIFANPLETNAPKPTDKNVLYIGPGEWNIDNIVVQSNQTLYIAGGAVVHGTIISSAASNIKIEGRGIIDGSKYPGYMLQGSVARVPLDLEKCNNVKVDGIILLDPNAWTFQANGTSNATVNNIKIISARPNGDGITLQSCKNITVTNSFVRSWDDSLVVKNYNVNTENITFNNMQVWTDLAQSCEVGYETNKGNAPNAVISDVTFENIDVINNFHKPVISLHDTDNALVENIHYKNITVENAQMGEGDAGTNDQLIDFDVNFSQWSSTQDRGNIRNITVDNVNVLSGKFSPSRIYGYDATHTIENVSINNLTILGKKITSLAQGKFDTNEFTKNITIK